jgi:PhnB protein
MAKTGQLPKNRHTVTAYIAVKDAPRAIEFYKTAFGAVENYRLCEPSGRIGHAEITIGDTVIMLSEEYPDFGALSPHTLGGSPVKFHISVENADTAVKRAVDAGAAILRPVEKQFYGDRSGLVVDPFGFGWFIGQSVEDVSPAEMQSRWNKVFEAGT